MRRLELLHRLQGDIASCPMRPRASCLARACDEPPRNSLDRSVQRRSERALPKSHRRDNSVLQDPGSRETRTGHAAA